LSAAAEDNRVYAVTLPALVPDAAPLTPPRPDWSVLDDIEVVLSVRLGAATLRLKELLALAPGDILALDTALNADVTVLVDGHLVAMGALVASECRFAVRVTRTAAA
jgi:flagellar motor switch protein FliN/FliY